MLLRWLPWIAIAVVPSTVAGKPDLSGLDAHQRVAVGIFAELIETNTTDSVGDNTAAAKLVQKKLIAAGYPEQDVVVLEPAPRKGNVVARLRSAAPRHRPILLLAHLDVVEADPADWSIPPFEFLERDGYFYGRGSSDDKDMASIWVANMIRMKREGYAPNRDIVMALTADEEGGDHNGVEFLIDEHRDLIDAELVLNEGGGGAIRNGVRVAHTVQAAEKLYQSFTFEVTNRGGHSSLPRDDNAIYRLADALEKLRSFRFPVALNEVTRAHFDALATMQNDKAERAAMHGLLASPPDAKAIARLEGDPMYNALLRTTCVATMLEAGHAENALPQRARATVNCRMLPGESPDDVAATLAKVVDDPEVAILPINRATPSPASPLTEEVMAPILAISEAMWPGVPVMPTMATGATDGFFFRRADIPTYGVSGIFADVDDVRAHGRDERLEKRAYLEGLDFLDRLVRAYTSD